VPSRCDGAGVAEERPAVADAGVSGTPPSETAVGRVNALLACRAVVRMAFNINMLFCFRFPPCVGGWRLAGLDEVSVRACDTWLSSPASNPRFLLESVATGSLIGQINPVRGVCAGRCCRSVSSDVWRECSEVRRRLETRVYTSGLWYIRLFIMKYATSGRTSSGDNRSRLWMMNRDGG